ncbi:MAG: choice-of-anchor D domain-containing protein [Patescibacteria group bacterium]
MKTILIFLALLLGTVLNAKDIASKDTVNGWYFLRANKDVDTAYTLLTDKSYEGVSAQFFGTSTKNWEDSVFWRKDLNKSYPFPKFVHGYASLYNIGKDSAGGSIIHVFIGNKKNPNIGYYMSAVGSDGYPFQHPEWYPRLYWLPIRERVFGPFVNKPDSVDFVIIMITHGYRNTDPRCEFIVDKLAFSYGKDNLWEDPTIDSSIVIDRFGDPAPAPIFKIDKKTLDFGAMGPNSTKTENINISNSGDAPLVISRVWTNNPSFSAKYETSIVEFGDSANLAIKFNQDSVRGLKKGLIFIEHKGANVRERAPDWSNALVIYLVDTTAKIDTISVSADFKEPDPSPIFKISKKIIDFGKVMAGIMKTDTVRITNTGDADLILSEVRTNSPNFSVILSAMTIGPKSSTDIVVNFIQDSVKGKKEGLLIIKHNGTEKIDTIQLLADFKEPDPVLKAQLSYSPKSADFGTLKINEVSHKDTLVVFKNTGNDTLRGSISIIGKVFSIDSINLLIAPMDSIVKTVRFAPAETGKVSGFLIITSNSPTSPDTVYLTGTGDKTTGVQNNPETPKDFSLSQNYPNPFNPSTTIEFSLPKSSLVNLTIYNMLGQEVKTLINRELNEGIHQVIWNAEVPSGTYFYRLTTNNGFVVAKKMILMK